MNKLKLIENGQMDESNYLEWAFDKRSIDLICLHFDQEQFERKLGFGFVIGAHMYVQETGLLSFIIYLRLKYMSLSHTYIWCVRNIFYRLTYNLFFYLYALFHQNTKRLSKIEICGFFQCSSVTELIRNI